MDTPNTSYNRGPQIEKPSVPGPKFSGRAFAGLIVIIVGSVFLLRQLNVPMPYWIVSWQMLLIAVGFFVGARHSFKGLGWTIPILIGTVFLVGNLVTDLPMHRFFWPILIIGAGLFMIFKPKKKEMFWGTIDTNEDMVDATAIFGGVKKNVITKNFKGGDVTAMFGGADINLAQADITGRVVLDVTTMFGGAKIIVPSHWQVNSDGVVAIFGGIEDKRAIMASPSYDTNKTLVLKGTVMFGGIDIKSF